MILHQMLSDFQNVAQDFLKSIETSHPGVVEWLGFVSV